jgi:hypothetical protein
MSEREFEFVHKNPKSFVTSGDMGDVIYHLLFIKKLGGTKYHIDPSPTSYERNGYIRVGDGNPGKFNLTKALFLLPLIKKQSYLKDVDFYSGDPLNAWKDYDVHIGEYHKDDLGIQNLTYFHAKKYNLSLEDLNEPWLEVKAARRMDPNRDTVISRTLRYRGNDNYYYFNRGALNERGVFVGLEEEYTDFIQRFGCPNIPLRRVDTALEMAEVVNGHQRFIGNGSLVASMALGLGLAVEYEFCPTAAHYIFKRENINIF